MFAANVTNSIFQGKCSTKAHFQAAKVATQLNDKITAQGEIVLATIEQESVTHRVVEMVGDMVQECRTALAEIKAIHDNHPDDQGVKEILDSTVLVIEQAMAQYNEISEIANDLAVDKKVNDDQDEDFEYA